MSQEYKQGIWDVLQRLKAAWTNEHQQVEAHYQDIEDDVLKTFITKEFTNGDQEENNQEGPGGKGSAENPGPATF